MRVLAVTVRLLVPAPRGPRAAAEAVRERINDACESGLAELFAITEVAEVAPEAMTDTSRAALDDRPLLVLGEDGELRVPEGG